MSVIKMKKVTVLCHQDDSEEVLEALQEAGVLHVMPIDQGERDSHGGSGDAVDQYEHLKRLARALGSVSPAPARLQEDARPVVEVIDIVSELIEQREALRRQHDRVVAQRNELKPWGDFDPEAVQELRDAGVPVLVIGSGYGVSRLVVPAASSSK